MEDVKRAYDRFTANEREILFSLINSKSAVIEDKRTSFSVLMAKKKAWQDIADGFNSYADVTHQSAPQLKKCWENKKARRKKLLAAESRRRMATGGGPFAPGESTDPELEAILSTPITYSVEGAIQFYLQLRGLRSLVRPNIFWLSCQLGLWLTTKQRTGKSCAMTYNRKCSPFPLSLHVKRWNHLDDDDCRPNHSGRLQASRDFSLKITQAFKRTDLPTLSAHR